MPARKLYWNYLKVWGNNMTDENTAVEKEPETQRSGWANMGIFLSTIAIILLLGGFGYGYLELSKVNVSIARKVVALESHAVNEQNAISTLQKSVTDLQQTAQKSQDLSSQQEQLMSEWRAAQKGDLDKWHIAEAQYLVKLANDHLQFSHNTYMAQTLLQQADHILESIQDASVLDVRKSIAADLANLQAAPVVDVTALYLQLTALNNQIDALPLPGTPLTAEGKQPGDVLPAANLPWWKAGLQRSWQSLRQIVIVRYNGSDALPLVMPEEKAFLYQNLHAQMEGVMWAVLHRSNDVYQTNLTRALVWIKQYFVQDAAVTKSVLHNMDVLQQINIQPPAANLSATLQLFDQYFAQSKQQTDNAVPGAAQ